MSTPIIRRRMMYGDLVNGLCYTAFLPVYAYLWWFEKGSSEGPRNIVLTFGCTTACCWISYVWNNSFASLMAVICMSASIAGMNLYQWPHSDEVVVVPQFLWTLLIISGNGPLPLGMKCLMGAMGLINAVTVAWWSPLLQVSDALPVLLGATAIFFGFHHYQYAVAAATDSSKKRTLVSARGASIILAGAFAYHVSVEIIAMMYVPNYALEGGYSILKAGFFACIGLAAAGAFRQEIDAKETLEALVQERTAEIRHQAERLHMVNRALQVSETAICIVDGAKPLRIVWSNAALERLISQPTQQEIHSGSLRDVLPSRLCDQLQKEGSVQTKEEDEDICINGKDFRVEISPFPASYDDGPISRTSCINSCSDSYSDEASSLPSSSLSRYLVVLKDVSSIREHERARKDAERKGMLADAMRESMQTLSHELRTPLQSILGITSLLLLDDEDGEERKLSTEVRESLITVMSSGNLLLTLINNILDVRKCDANMLEKFELSSCHLSSCLSDALKFCEPFATVMKVRLRCVCPTESTPVVPPPNFPHMSTRTQMYHSDSSNISTNSNNNSNIFVQTNSLRFQQVMINLLSNAVKHTPENRNVYIHSSVMRLADVDVMMNEALAATPRPYTENCSSSFGDRKVAVVSVEDEGLGIPADQCHRLFEKFVQLDNNRGPSNKSISSGSAGCGPAPSSPAPGTGLGLNLCLKFVHRMNGTIWVQRNASGVGMCFSFYLPLGTQTEHDADASAGVRPGRRVRVWDALAQNTNDANLSAGLAADQPQRDEPGHPEQHQQQEQNAIPCNTAAIVKEVFPTPQPTPQMEDPPLPFHQRYRILLVDDMKINLKVFDRMLQRAGVQHVTCVDSGPKALVALATGDYNLVLTDVQMPEMSGPELSVAISKASTIPVKPLVVAITAGVSDATDAECRAAGIAHVLHKPVTTRQMQAFLETVVPTLLPVPLPIMVGI